MRGPHCSLLCDGEAGGALANFLATFHAFVEFVMASDSRVCRLLDLLMPGLQTCPTEVSVRVSERRQGGLNSRRFSLGFFRMKALEFDGSMYFSLRTAGVLVNFSPIFFELVQAVCAEIGFDLATHLSACGAKSGHPWLARPSILVTRNFNLIAFANFCLCRVIFS